MRICPGLLKVVNNDHNHDPVETLSALPQHRISAMSEEERGLVNSMHRLGNGPTQILGALQSSNPASHLIVKDIYNLLHKL